MEERDVKIHVFSGPIDSGKTGRLKLEIKGLMKGGYRVGGVLSEAVMSKGVKTGYRAVDIETVKKILLVSEESLDPDIRTGRFCFSRKGFERVSTRLLNLRDRDVLVIDEIGPLELKGGGYSDALRIILETYEGLLLLVIRDYLIDDIINAFGLNRFIVTTTLCSISEPVSFEPWS